MAELRIVIRGIVLYLKSGIESRAFSSVFHNFSISSDPPDVKNRVVLVFYRRVFHRNREYLCRNLAFITAPAILDRYVIAYIDIG